MTGVISYPSESATHCLVFPEQHWIRISAIVDATSWIVATEQLELVDIKVIRNTIGLGLDSPTRSTSAPPQDPDARPGAFIGGAARRKARRDQAPVSPPNAQAPPRSSLAPICDRVSGNLIAARNYHYQLPRLVHHHRHRAITALTRHRHSDNSRRRRDSLSAAVSRSSAAVTQRPRDRPVPSVVVAGRTYVHPSTHPSSLPPYGSQRRFYRLRRRFWRHISTT
ncbi:hypothetical protein BJ166DRAFT_374852 [Pestalotiopsis sp. NC0098]|nr:hypothetical protein BJ166DRAFT_374852 [Pestalotiopsis sp. NC0098]